MPLVATTGPAFGLLVTPAARSVFPSSTTLVTLTVERPAGVHVLPPVVERYSPLLVPSTSVFGLLLLTAIVQYQFATGTGPVAAEADSASTRATSTAGIPALSSRPIILEPPIVFPESSTCLTQGRMAAFPQNAISRMPRKTRAAPITASATMSAFTPFSFIQALNRAITPGVQSGATANATSGASRRTSMT